MVVRVRWTAALVFALGLGAVVTGPVSTPAGAAPAVAPVVLPTAESSSPAVVSMVAGRTDVFSRSADGELVQQYRLAGGGWRRPLNRGGSLQSQPAVVSWGPGRLDVFARGTDNHLWQRFYAQGSWSEWIDLGGRLRSAPAVTSWGQGRLDVFAVDEGSRLIHNSFANGAWSGWRGRGGVLTSSPAAASWGEGRLDVVGRGGDNLMWHRSMTSGQGWSRWRRVGNELTSQPAIAARAPGELDVVVRSTGNVLEHARFVAGSGWSSWTQVGTASFSSGPGLGLRNGDVVLAARRGASTYLKVRTAATGSWSASQLVDHLRPFRGLATWVDVLDYPSLKPGPVVADIASRGVRALFLSTARFNSSSDFYDQAEMGQWLDAAHAHGLRVMGWYVPAYGNMTRDVRRVVAIDRYVSPGGQRFDAIGIDIERFGASGEVGRSTFNTRLVQHLREVRPKTTAPLAAIVPSPYATNPGNNWTGFPWSRIGPRSDAVVPMALWSFRSGFSASQVRAWVRDQVDRTQALTGRPVHVEGGVDGEGSTAVTSARVQAFVDAARGGEAIGGSNYDYRTTRPGLWPILTGLKS